MPTPLVPTSPRTELGAFDAAAGFGVLVLLFAIGCSPRAEPEATLPPPPETRTDDVVETIHGVDIADPYRWLEDQESGDTRAWIDEQNAYTDQILEELPGREVLRVRFAELLEIDQVGFPTEAGGRYFFSKRRADQDLFVLYMCEGLDGEDQVLLDPHPASEDHTTSYTLQTVSQDGTLLIYGIRRGGEDELEIKVFDVDGREHLPDRFARGRYYGVAITPDKKTVYYTRQTEDGPRVFRHRMGDDAAEDPIIFGEDQDPGRILFASLSEDGRYLLVHVLHGSSGDKVDLYLDDFEDARGFRTVVEGVDAGFFAGMAGDRLIVQTTWKAPNGRVMAASAAKPEIEHWVELIPEHRSAVIDGLSAVGGRLFVNYLEDVQSQVVRFDLRGRRLGKIAFDSIGTVSTMGGHFGRPEAFFAFTSFHLPSTIYRYDVETDERTVWARPEVPVDGDAIEIEQVWYESKDGTRVPMFLVHKKGLEMDGARPTLLTGYGGFNASLTPSFRASAVVWVEHGGIYAIANLRGGGELGESWHQAGMRENKQNVFDDFIGAAEYLIDRGYTSPAKLAIQGGSNGGLLVGTVANQRPDLYAAVICSYPLLDMVRYHQFMVARYWVPEYGSSEDPEQFRYLYAYSPYHNVRADGAYPAMLFITGDGDTRVAPLHARKMAARLQAESRSGEPILLRYHTKAGHSGGVPTSEQIANSVESYSFLFWQLGEPMADPAAPTLAAPAPQT